MRRKEVCGGEERKGKEEAVKQNNNYIIIRISFTCRAMPSWSSVGEMGRKLFTILRLQLSSSLDCCCSGACLWSTDTCCNVTRPSSSFPSTGVLCGARGSSNCDETGETKLLGDISFQMLGTTGILSGEAPFLFGDGAFVDVPGSSSVPTALPSSLGDNAPDSLCDNVLGDNDNTPGSLSDGVSGLVVSFGDVHILLGDVSFGDISLDDIPLSDVALGDVSFGDISLGDIPLSDVALGDVSLDDVALDGTPLSDGSLGSVLGSGIADVPVSIDDVSGNCLGGLATSDSAAVTGGGVLTNAPEERGCLSSVKRDHWSKGGRGLVELSRDDRDCLP